MPELMKGHTWKDHAHKMTYPCIVEAKYDEIRCHVKVNYSPEDGRAILFLAYSGKPLANMQFFVGDFAELSRLTGHSEFDCGFEVNGNFNDSYRWVRSTRGIPADLINAPVKFVLYDLPDLQNRPYISRVYTRDGVAAIAERHTDLPLHVPYSVLCNTPQEVDAFYNELILTGYEGAMVKSQDHQYIKGKRIYGWLKMKPEEDADGVITELHEAVCGKDQPELGLREGDLLGRIGSVTLLLEDGSSATPHGIPHDLGRRMLEQPHAFIGQWVEFVYMERDRQGGYRHPRFKRFREEKA